MKNIKTLAVVTVAGLAICGFAIAQGHCSARAYGAQDHFKDTASTAEHLTEVFAKVCLYIIDNARKEGLVQHPNEWKFCGAIVPGHPAMHPLEQDFWPKFWKLYRGNLAEDASRIIRPPF